METFQEVVDASTLEGQFPDYSWFRRASIKQLLKLDQEAEEDFMQLKTSAAWLHHTCLQSLAQLELKKAKSAFGTYFPQRGVECCQRALNLLSELVH